MERLMQKEEQYRRILQVVRIVYVFAGLWIAISGIIHSDSYAWPLALSTLLVLPGLWLARRLFKIRGGWQLETHILLFSLLGWTLGGAGRWYGNVPYYDKVVHGLSGVFVSMLALAAYQMLERGHSREGENPATGCWFVFFTSTAVAGLFELCEFALAPLMQRDLQHVLDTGVGDTMCDMLVCLAGTLAAVWMIHRSRKGKHNFITDAADALVGQNPLEPVKSE